MTKPTFIVFASPNLRSRFHQFVIAGNYELTGGSNVNDTSFDNEIEKWVKMFVFQITIIIAVKW